MAESKLKNDVKRSWVSFFCSSLCLVLQASEATRMAEHSVEDNISRQMEAMVVVHQATSVAWCVAKSSASDADLQNALDWACGQETNQGNVDCSPISSGGQCFSPDTLLAHASYAFNAYFQKNSQAAGTCDFLSCAESTMSDPSTSSCSYQSTFSSFYSTNVSSASPDLNNFNGTSTSSSSGANAHFLWVVVFGIIPMLAASNSL